MSNVHVLPGCTVLRDQNSNIIVTPLKDIEAYARGEIVLDAHELRAIASEFLELKEFSRDMIEIIRGMQC